MSQALYAILEPTIVAVIVLISIIVVLRKQAPKLWARLTGKSSGAHCGDDSSKVCNSGCGSCGDSSAPQQHPIKLHKM